MDFKQDPDNRPLWTAIDGSWKIIIWKASPLDRDDSGYKFQIYKKDNLEFEGRAGSFDQAKSKTEKMISNIRNYFRNNRKR